jgi:hypothetical protein
MKHIILLCPRDFHPGLEEKEGELPVNQVVWLFLDKKGGSG